MKYKLLSLIVCTLTLVGLVGATASAAPIGPGDPGAPPASSNSCPDNQGDCAKTTSFSFAGCGSTDVGIKCLFVEILAFLSVGVGIAVVGGIAIGGITYATSQGNPAGTQKGIMIITNAIIGLILYLLMFALLQFLVPGGVFS